jgi:hypothetical protein
MPLTTAVVEADSMGGGGRPSEAEIVSGVMLLAASCGVMPLGEDDGVMPSQGDVGAMPMRGDHGQEGLSLL